MMSFKVDTLTSLLGDIICEIYYHLPGLYISCKKKIRAICFKITGIQNTCLNTYLLSQNSSVSYGLKMGSNFSYKFCSI